MAPALPATESKAITSPVPGAIGNADRQPVYGSSEVASGSRTLALGERATRGPKFADSAELSTPAPLADPTHEPDDETDVDRYGVRETLSRPTLSAIDHATAALVRIATAEATGAERAYAARTLREVAFNERTRHPRTASVALLLSDALVFTPEERINATARRQLARALGVLLEPFVPQEREEAAYTALLDGGWQLTASFNPDEFAELAAAVD